MGVMSSAILGGNYTSEIWPEVMKCVEERNLTAWVKLVQGHPPEEIKSPYFLVIDIHGFSKFCKKCARQSRKESGNMKEVAGLLRAFFWTMSEYIRFKGGISVKFIGDAILAIHERRSQLIKLSKELLIRYRNDFKKTYPQTDIVVGITHPRECLKGFVGGADYVDYSYWAPGLNYLFTEIKKRKHGHVYFIRRDGKAVRYDR